MGGIAKTDTRHRQCRRCCRACSCIAFVLGVLFLIVGIWSVHLKQRFTPIYTPITCQVEPASVDNVDWGHLFSGFSFTLKSVIKCDNPNPYSVTLQSTKGGKVYMGRDMTPAGVIKEIPRATLPARGRGAITSFVEIRPTGDTIASGIGSFFSSQETPLYFESNVELLISVNLLGRAVFNTKKSISRDCGLSMKLPKLGNFDTRLGPTVCGESFDALTLPPVGEAEQQTAGEDRLVLGAASAGPELEEATRLKDESLLLGTALGFSLGAVLLLCSLVGLCLLLRPCRRGAREQGVNAGKESASVGESSLPRILSGQCPAAEAKTVQAKEASAPAKAGHDEELGL